MNLKNEQGIFLFIYVCIYILVTYIHLKCINTILKLKYALSYRNVIFGYQSIESYIRKIKDRFFVNLSKFNQKQYSKNEFQNTGIKASY